MNKFFLIFIFGSVIVSLGISPISVFAQISSPSAITAIPTIFSTIAPTVVITQSSQSTPTIIENSPTTIPTSQFVPTDAGNTSPKSAFYEEAPPKLTPTPIGSDKEMILCSWQRSSYIKLFLDQEGQNNYFCTLDANGHIPDRSHDLILNSANDSCPTTEQNYVNTRQNLSGIPFCSNTGKGTLTGVYTLNSEYISPNPTTTPTPTLTSIKKIAYNFIPMPIKQISSHVKSFFTNTWFGVINLFNHNSDVLDVNRSYTFNGNNYVEISNRNLPTGNSNRTLFVRVKISRFTSNVANPSDSQEAFFAGYGNFGSYSQEYAVGTAGNELYFSQWGQSFNGPSLKTNTWYNVVVTNMGNQESLYLNGRLVNKGNLSLNTPKGYPLYIGRVPGYLGNTRKLIGTVSEVEVFNYALNQSQISKL